MAEMSLREPAFEFARRGGQRHRRRSMKRTLVGLAAILLTTSAALAVGRTTDTSAGKAYVTDRGFTLYMLSSDKSNYSTCYAQCTKIWPPYRATAGAKYKHGWAIITRRDGTRMWAYKGHQLY